MAGRRGDAATAERTVRFYRVDNGLDDAGQALSWAPGPPLKQLQALWQSGDLYMDRRDGSFLTCWVDAIGARPQARLGIIRRTDLPEIEEAGRLTPLELEEDAGLAERVHLIFFPDRVLGADFNWYGPRPSAFARFHNDKLHATTEPISVDPLLSSDVSERLDRLQGIRLFEMKVKRSFAQEIRDIDSGLSRALRAAAEVGNAETIGLALSPEPYSRESLGERVKEIARAILGRPDLLEDARQLRVKGYDPETETVEEIDLLKSQILTSKRIVKVRYRGRTLDPDAAYGAIEEAYGELRRDIRTASSVSLATHA